MSEIIERVAAIIWNYDNPSSFDDLDEASKNGCRETASAIIKAMREPTEAMVGAVYRHKPELDCVRGHDLSGDEALAVFMIMIDRALKDE